MGWPPYPGVGPPIPPAMTRDQEVNVLKRQVEFFEDALDAVRRRIKEVESREDKTAR